MDACVTLAAVLFRALQADRSRRVGIGRVSDADRGCAAADDVTAAPDDTGSVPDSRDKRPG
jgi:hypothetical protein